MRFDIDKQTIRDLELFPERRNDKSILSVYNKTETVGGREFLYKVFSSPVSNRELLENRKNEINFFVNNACSITFNSGQLDFIEYYFRNQKAPLRPNFIDAAADKVKNLFKENNDYYTITQGISHIIRLFGKLKVFINEARMVNVPETLNHDFERVISFISSKSLNSILAQSGALSFSQINNLDYLLRYKVKNEFREVVDVVYKIDVLQTLAGLMKNEDFTLPEYLAGENTGFEVSNAFHPLLSSPVSNSFSFTHGSNLCFITGPNMSGKSTFLKTMGLMVYLAHLGFPVPAKRLSLSLFDGLYTTINLPDNLNLGYSHFYSEVKRVKDLVVKIDTDKRHFIIFDELFRGTNVKDAYDASLIIMSALAKIQNNLFFISTHILEVAENIENKESILFRCFESELVDKTPVYDFRIKNGISKERVGLSIIKNEDIIEILEKIVSKQKQ
ncbi:MAG TPA: hypothetical protein VK172_15270 [Lentimicrobium sp.]|nr:hypothetical protein [Lentimicrobium sp.]